MKNRSWDRIRNPLCPPGGVGDVRRVPTISRPTEGLSQAVSCTLPGKGSSCSPRCHCPAARKSCHSAVAHWKVEPYRFSSAPKFMPVKSCLKWWLRLGRYLSILYFQCVLLKTAIAFG